jgi:hypothetical protein
MAGVDVAQLLAAYAQMQQQQQQRAPYGAPAYAPMQPMTSWPGYPPVAQPAPDLASLQLAQIAQALLRQNPRATFEDLQAASVPVPSPAAAVGSGALQASVPSPAMSPTVTTSPGEPNEGDPLATMLEDVRAALSALMAGQHELGAELEAVRGELAAAATERSALRAEVQRQTGALVQLGQAVALLAQQVRLQTATAPAAVGPQASPRNVVPGAAQPSCEGAAPSVPSLAVLSEPPVPAAALPTGTSPLAAAGVPALSLVQQAAREDDAAAAPAPWATSG